MAKRGNSEGSISKRSDGRWMARLSLPSGKRKYFYADTRAEVAQKLAAATRDRDQGLPVMGERLTVGQHLDTWLENSVKPSVRPRTHESYESHVRVHLKPALGKIALAKLSPAQVQAFMNQKLAEGLSPATVLRIRATLRKALNQAMRWELVHRNVATLVDAPKATRPKVEPMTPDEARRFLAAIKGDRLEALYNLVLAIGLRKGEALGLLWEDVDLDRGRVTIRRALQRIDRRPQLVETKSERSWRTLPLPQPLIPQLREHRARQNRDRLLAGERWQDWGLVFASKEGTPLDTMNVTHRFQAILEREGLPRQRFHDLRHCCATYLLVQGVDLQVVKETLGHSQISLTADTYAHVMPSLKQDAADRMGELLWGGSESG